MARGGTLQFSELTIQRVVDYWHDGYIASEIAEKMPKYSSARIAQICEDQPETGERRRKRIARAERRGAPFRWGKGPISDDAIAALYVDFVTGYPRAYVPIKDVPNFVMVAAE